jgi:hypothetical protein
MMATATLKDGERIADIVTAEALGISRMPIAILDVSKSITLRYTTYQSQPTAILRTPSS